MKKQERAQKIQAILNDLFPHPAIPLNHEDPYTLLIAVLLSARCTDERVNQVTPALFKRAKTPKAMAKLDEDEIRSYIKICGLSNTKAKAIKELSQILVDRYKGKVPQTFEELEELPGVGHKTASVVMSQAFGIPAIPVDTHIHRSAKRWKLSSGKNTTTTENDLKKLFKEEDWNKLHLQMIHFARKYCPAIGHDPKKCPICSWL